MLHRPIALLTVLCMLLPVGAAHATLVSIDDSAFGTGALTQDSATGFQWLDLTLTGARSYNDMVGNDGSNEFVAGGDFAGFRYATLTEVEQLWIAAGIAPSHIYHEGPPATGTFETNDGATFSSARALQELIGYVLTTANPPFTNADGWRSNAVALDGSGVGYASLDTCSVGTGFCRGSSLPMTRAHLSPANVYWETYQWQHWLLREGAVVGQAPEPTTLALLVAALILLARGQRRIRALSSRN